MLKSMTGFGVARREAAGWQLVVELKVVNGRFLKTTFKVPSMLSSREHILEEWVRARLRRGSVMVTLLLKRQGVAGVVAFNEEVAIAYQKAFLRLGLPYDSIPLLPGVISNADEGEELPEAAWSLVSEGMQDALASVVDMRQREGQVLQGVLRELCERIDALRLQVRQRAPTVVKEYQEKLTQRVAALLTGSAVTAERSVDPQLIAREVALYADRSDVTEEVERLGSHIEQVRRLLTQDGEAGRTLEFLAQEMHREVNTIGAKSADAELSYCVVQLKAEVERFKEQVANIE